MDTKLKRLTIYLGMWIAVNLICYFISPPLVILSNIAGFIELEKYRKDFY